jgi:hypothetical protein
LSPRWIQTVEEVGPFTRITETIDKSPLDLYAGLLTPWGGFAWLTANRAEPFSPVAVPIVAQIVPLTRTIEVLSLVVPRGLPRGEYWFYAGYVRPGRQAVSAELVEPILAAAFILF